jgi:isopenicillin N synthase-like dioxygenase
MTDLTGIPVLDAQALSTGDIAALEVFATDFRHSYETIGFGCIVNHGIDSALIRQVFDASARFHALPLDTKMAVELNSQHRGYIPINSSMDVNSRYAEIKRPNQSESFMMMREDAPDSPDVLAGAYLAGPNQWPELAGTTTPFATSAGDSSPLRPWPLGAIPPSSCRPSSVRPPGCACCTTRRFRRIARATFSALRPTAISAA